MQKLIDGIHEFKHSVFDSHKPLFEGLAQGQKPLALFITCSDSRIDPNLLTQTKPGELFVIRNAGNIVPRYNDVLAGEAATIEYAVKVLKVKDVIICGHSQCGAMGGLLTPDSLTELEAVKAWLTHAEATAKIIKENYGHLEDSAARLATTVEQNVLVQLDNLRTHPSVADAESAGDLKLHGWTYTFETGEVLAHEKEAGKFVSVKS